MMAVGESGLGKSTLINSLFLTNLYEEREVPEGKGPKLEQQMEIPMAKFAIVNLKLGIY